MKRSTLALALCVALQPAVAMIEIEEVQTVRINGGYSGGYSSIGGGYSSGYSTGSSYSGGIYRDGGGTYAAAAVSSVTLSSDVRCNPVAQANEYIRNTTSASDPLDRYMSAHTLFRLIYAQLGGNVMQTALAVMPKSTLLIGDKPAVLWKTTWHDGSTSTYLIGHFLPPMFTDRQPSVNGNTPPTGDTSCPAKG
jgi:hypothetical protein